MEEKRQFKGVWIPAEVWLDENLSIIEKCLLTEIDSLEDNEKGCYASNKYFSGFFKVSTARISQLINNLKKKNYIRIDYEYNEKEIIARHIFLNRPPYPVELGIKNIKGGSKYSKEMYLENYKDNNILINNTINNNNNSSSSDTIFDFIENNFGRLLNPIEYEVISQWEDNELTRYAIKQAVLNSKFNVKYINTILHNYQMCGIRNVQEAEEQEKRFKNKYTKKKDELEEWLNEHEGI